MSYHKQHQALKTQLAGEASGKVFKNTNPRAKALNALANRKQKTRVRKRYGGVRSLRGDVKRKPSTRKFRSKRERPAYQGPKLTRKQIRTKVWKLLNPSTKITAMRQLIGQGKTGADELGRFLGHRNKRLAEAVARTLSQFKPNHATPVLLQKLKSGGTKTRIHAAWSLSMMRGLSKKTVPSLVRALGDRNKTVRFHAIWALAEMKKGARSALPHLRRLSRDRDFYVKDSAKYAIKRIGRP